MKPFRPSDEQTAIFEAVKVTQNNIAIEALAGTGKTTTLVEIARLLPYEGAKIFCAFNKSIVDELNRRMIGTGVRAQTFHSIGNQALARHLGKARLETRNYKYNDIVKPWAASNDALTAVITEAAQGVKDPADRQGFIEDMHKETVKMTVELLSMLRYKLTEWDDADELHDLITQYRMDDDIENNVEIIDVVLSAVPKLMSVAENQTNNHIIDFTDMIYWPVKWNLTLNKYQFVLVDEVQDMSPMQRAMIQMITGGRVFIVGDPHQAIYHWAGADSDSFERSVDQFDCTVYPLTITRRCSQLVTQHAANLVEAFKCPADHPQGKVLWLEDSRLTEYAAPGDFILCRLKSPLVAAALAFIAAGKPATILGSEIGKALISILEKIERRKGYTFPTLIDDLLSYEEERVEHYNKRNDQAMAENVRDQCAALRVVIENAQANDLMAVKYRIETLFSNDQGIDGKITLGTIHKTKGLEARRVFIMKPDKLPLRYENQIPEAVIQEGNLDYVARTRAIEELIYCVDDKYRRKNTRPPYAVEVSVKDTEPVEAKPILPDCQWCGLKPSPEGTPCVECYEKIVTGKAPANSTPTPLTVVVEPNQKLLALITAMRGDEIDHLIELLQAAKEKLAHAELN